MSPDLQFHAWWRADHDNWYASDDRLMIMWRWWDNYHQPGLTVFIIIDTSVMMVSVLKRKFLVNHDILSHKLFLWMNPRQWISAYFRSPVSVVYTWVVISSGHCKHIQPSTDWCDGSCCNIRNPSKNTQSISNCLKWMRNKNLKVRQIILFKI